jgi:hypothetical protein
LALNLEAHMCKEARVQYGVDGRRIMRAALRDTP